MKSPMVLWPLLASILYTNARAQIDLNAQAVLGVSTAIDHPTTESPTQTRWFDETALLKLHRQLVQIESTTYYEQDAGHFLAHYLRQPPFNFTVEKIYLPHSSSNTQSRRFNVYARPSGRNTTRTILTSHIDTVPPYIPYKRHKNSTHDIISGRGTADAKGCVAAQIFAYLSLAHSHPQYADDVSLLFVVGEETGGDGMRAASAKLDTFNTSAVIFGEPTEGRLVSGHKGILACNVLLHGVGAHSGYPWLGKSANEMLLPILKALARVQDRLPWSDKYGNTTMNLGRIEGGVAANVVAETARIDINFRLAAGTPEDIERIVNKALEEATEEATGGDERASVSAIWPGSGYGPVPLDTDVEGFGEPITVNYGTDVHNFEGGFKRYLYGPGSILVAHSDHEAISVEDLRNAVDGYKRLLLASLEKT